MDDRTLSKAASWAQSSDSVEAERLAIDASRFVLIVDDDPDLLEVTSFVIENEGVVVQTARNGAEALAQLRAGRAPGLVLLDLMMPVMNGWEFLSEVARDPALKKIPVVVLTAGAHTHVPGAREVLPKPLDLKALLRAVEHYVRGDDEPGA
ncbi:MAG TPA: response regulator [Kofleriaceae bacterium]|nr:response regulator [Kofleriaceae bacterium]